MPDDTGSDGVAAGDSQKETECEAKLAEFDRLEIAYNDAHAVYWGAADAYALHKKDADKAFADWTKAKDDKQANETAITDANKRIEEIDARIAQIDAIDPQAEIDKRMPSAMGDSSDYFDFGRNEPWASIDYYLGLLDERRDLVSERQAKVGEIAEAEGKRAELDQAIEDASTAKGDLATEVAPFETAKIQAWENADVAFKDWHGQWAKYEDYECAPLTGELDEPEKLPAYSEAE